MVVTWAVIVVLILLCALYVAAEFAAVSVRQSRIHQLAREGNRMAAILLPMIETPPKLDRYIAACQIGITITNLGLGAFSQATLAAEFAPLFQRWGGMSELAAQSTSAVTVLVLMTVLIMIAGELVPKSLALQLPTQTALATALPMRWSLVLLSWIITILNGNGALILKLLGAPPSSHHHVHSPEEIALLIAESRDGGLLEPDEHRRLQSALKLGRRTVHSLMVPRRDMLAIDVNAPPERILAELVESPFTRLPVYEGSIDNVIGAIHTRDVVVRYAERPEALPIRDLVRPLTAVPASMTADRLIVTMRQLSCQQVIAIDEHGGVEGLVTLEDLLEEVFGEIGDEHVADRERPERLPDGRVRLPGFLRVDEAEPWIGVLWESEADTVGGHVTFTLGRMPVEGDRLTIDGVDVEVERVARRAVASLVATPVRTREESDRG